MAEAIKKNLSMIPQQSLAHMAILSSQKLPPAKKRLKKLSPVKNEEKKAKPEKNKIPKQTNETGQESKKIQKHLNNINESQTNYQKF